MKMYWLSMWSDCCFNGDFSAKRFTIVFRYLPLNDVFYYLTHECRQGECLVEEVDISLPAGEKIEETKPLKPLEDSELLNIVEPDYECPYCKQHDIKFGYFCAFCSERFEDVKS